MISDFAVFLTIVVMVLLDYVIGVPSQKLQVPSKFEVSGAEGLVAPGAEIRMKPDHLLHL